MKLKQFLIYVLLFFLPTQFGKHFFFTFSIINGVRIDYLAPTLYFTDILIGILLGLYISSLKIQLDKKIYIFVVLTVVTIFFALSPWIALYKLIKYTEIIILLYILINTKISSKLFLGTLLVSTLFQLFIALNQVISGKALQGIMYFFGERYFTLSTPGIAKVALQGKEFLRAYGTFSHPNSLAGFYLLLYTYILFEKKFNKYIVIKYTILSLCSILIFISFSKISIVLFLIVTSIYLFQTITCRLCIYGRIFGLLILSFAFMSAHGDGESLDKRVSLAIDAFKIILSHPLFGVGIGNYVIAQSEFPIKYSYYFLQPVHNVFLLVMAEIGIPLFTVVAYYVSKFLKSVYINKRYIMIPLLIVLFITSFFDHYWVTLQQNMLLLPVVFGLLKNQKWQ